MDRRAFIAAAAAAVATAHGTLHAQDRDEGGVRGDAEAEAVRQRLIEWYRAFGNSAVDRTYYADFMTDDYLLCEHGELLDKSGDMAMLEALPSDQVRTDSFDFRRITVAGDHADLVYFLDSEMTDSVRGRRSRRWLESAVARREGGQWRFSILHSTRIEPPAG